MPRKTALRWKAQYRIIPTRYPLVDLFERSDLTEREKRALYYSLRRVNPRLRQLAGDISLVRDGDMVQGANASIVMAAFTHTGYPTRFSTGSYGVYYAARSQETAIRETVYHTEREARMARLAPQAFHRRVFIGKIAKSFYDVRGVGYADLHARNNYSTSQGFAQRLRSADPDAWGFVYNSVRHAGGDCIAALRPPAVTLPTQGPHLFYAWDGTKITAAFEQSEPLITF
ncbi:MAG: RES family NAD+ phosphorylase [Gammaproteobacteria bacterium]